MGLLIQAPQISLFWPIFGSLRKSNDPKFVIAVIPLCILPHFLANISQFVCAFCPNTFVILITQGVDFVFSKKVRIIST